MNLRFISDLNFVRFYKQELDRIENGEKITKILNENSRKNLRYLGLTDGIGKNHRLTTYAKKLMKMVENENKK